MILDNVDDIEVFYPKQTGSRDEPSGSATAPLAVYLPQSHNGSILITSRSKDAAARLTGGYKNIKEVHVMDESQGLQLLQNKLQDIMNDEGAADLLSALDYIPLAITQAAAYINRRTRMTASGYLKEYRRNDKKKEGLLNRDAGDLRRDETASNSVVTTWQISFERIREERRSATELLSLMSFFNPQGIPESILRIYRRKAAMTGDEDEADSEFDDDLDTLQAYSLITATNNDVCEMHALVQFCTRAWLSSFGDVERWKQEFLGLMEMEFPTGRFENWAKCQQLLPHVQSLYDSEPAGDKSLKEWAQLLTNAAWYMWKKGNYRVAQDLAAKAAVARERTLGQDDRRTLTTITILASVLWNQGKYDEAETLNRRVLEGWEKELGKQHPNTLKAINDLALVLQDQGKYDEAETLNQRVLEGLEKELGKQHSGTLRSVNNLASVLQDRGKYDEAEILSRQAVEGREKELGKQHPDTLRSVSNLALVLRGQGKYDEAETLNRRALEGREKELGKKHPDTLASVYCLAYLLQERKQYEEASELYQRACDGYKQKLGSQHPTTIACHNHYSTMQQEAEQAAVTQRKRGFGIMK
jgi:tetratricopeptide (TPR) repeat protein